MQDNASAQAAKHHKMLNLWVAATILIVSSILVFASWLEYNEAEKNAWVSTQNLAKTLELSLSNMIRSIDIALAAATDEFEQQSAQGPINKEAFNQFLLRQKRFLPYAGVLLATDEHGKITYGETVPSSFTSVADRDYFPILRDHPDIRFHIGKPVKGRVFGHEILPMLRRLNKPDGSFCGLVMASIRFNDLDRILATVELAAGGSIALRDSDLGLITRYPKLNNVQNTIGNKDTSPEFAAALKKNRLLGSFTSSGLGLNQEKSLRSYRYNEQYGIFINVGFSHEAVFAKWRQQAAIMAGLWVGFIVMSLFFLRMIQRAWRQQELDATALQTKQAALLQAVEQEKLLSNQIAEKNAQLLAHTQQLDDTVAQRTSELNASLISTQQAKAELIELNTTLEAKVAERTEALSQAKQLAEQAKQVAEEAKQVAEAATRAKSEFLSNMSHEIRTPLNAIIGLSFLAQKTASDPKQATYLQKIHLSGEHLLGIINNILDYSKIEVGMLVIESSDFELRQMLNTVRDLIEPKAHEKGLQYAVELDPALPAMLRGDPLRLTQVLLNFAANAIKFSSAGTVLVRVTQVEQSADQSAEQNTTHCSLLMEVKDSGIGLSEEQQAQLFQPFQQADTSTTRQFGGTGLGLSICKQLADLMGGEVGVTSNIGAGSTFWFKVRLSQCQKPVQTVQAIQAGQTGQTAKISEQELSPQAAKSIRNARILLAEDNEFNQEIAVELLESAGAIVTVANNGAEAVKMALASDTVFDCILMDLQMPVMDGFQATAKIRGEPRYARVPILAMSANTRSEDRQRGSAAGMNDFISKPTPPALLYAMLGKYLSQHRQT